MAHETYDLTVVSPMFLNGATPNQPEFRAASVRGQLRYWLRAIEGAKTQDLKIVRESESATFGSTGQGSTVTVRLFPKGNIIPEKSNMLPHRQEEHKRFPQPAIQPNSKAQLEFVTRLGVSIPKDAFHALNIWSLIGGLGKRSRRMFGAFMLVGEGLSVYKTPHELAQCIKKSLIAAGCEHGSPQKAIPKFPILHPDHSWIIVGHKSFDDPESAVVSLFTSLLRSATFRPKQETFGSALPRRSSPLIAQLRRMDGKYYAVLTALRSQPNVKIDWEHLKRFMETAKQVFNAPKENVWGGW